MEEFCERQFGTILILPTVRQQQALVSKKSLKRLSRQEYNNASLAKKLYLKKVQAYR